MTTTWEQIESLAAKAGAKYPALVAAQWALESGWGQHQSGKNNFFGIKGKGTVVSTKEFINGQWITIRDEFKDFASPEDCVNDLVSKWYKDYKSYRGVNRATSPDECARLLVTEKYATDPAYADKLIRILRDND